MALIPKYSKELILTLNSEVGPPQLPTNPEGWARVNESEMRRAAFLAGRRSIVEELVAALEEDNADPSTSPVSSGSTQTRSIQEHNPVAPTRMAPGDVGLHDIIQSDRWDG
jgi:hypothetical protein